MSRLCSPPGGSPGRAALRLPPTDRRARLEVVAFPLQALPAPGQKARGTAVHSVSAASNPRSDRAPPDATPLATHRPARPTVRPSPTDPAPQPPVSLAALADRLCVRSQLPPARPAQPSTPTSSQPRPTAPSQPHLTTLRPAFGRPSHAPFVRRSGTTSSWASWLRTMVGPTWPRRMEPPPGTSARRYGAVWKGVRGQVPRRTRGTEPAIGGRFKGHPLGRISLDPPTW